MDACDVLIVGGGPAGSSCAWALRNSGFDPVVLDKQTFPRDKVCGGWITPGVLDALKIEAGEYAARHTLQPITGFRTGCIGGPAVETSYGAPVSYGIRRREFDDYLLRRSGARILEGTPLASLERSGDSWIVNGKIRAPLVVGAGGHFCPVARLVGAGAAHESVVVAQEAEFEMDTAQLAGCSIRCEVPELYFCLDMKGYGWCFRKENFLNVGLGRLDQHRLASHIAGFLQFLKWEGRISFDLPSAPCGHAYLLRNTSTREIVGDGYLLIGDAAGLAHSLSGEGIHPAVESGLLAAKAIVAANGKYGREQLEPYRAMLDARLGSADHHWATRIGRHLPAGMVSILARRLLTTRWFARDVVLNRWFLRGEHRLESRRQTESQPHSLIE